jgi:ferredoxin
MGYPEKIVNAFLKLWYFTHPLKKLSSYTPVKQIIAPLISDRMTSATYLPLHQDIALPESTVAPYRLLEEMLRKSAVRFRFNHCICRNQEGCTNYPHELGCIFIGEAAADIDQALGRRISVEEALEQVQEAARLGLPGMIGHLWMDALSLGVFRKFDNFLVICFCCDCCCLLRTDMKVASQGFHDILKRLDGITITVSDECIGCGTCAEQCFVQAIRVEGGKALHDEEKCKACGRCAVVCPREAVGFTFDDADKMLLDLYRRVEGTTNIR